ncbi:hypothetical protein Rhopal_001899-T1 [Rhodotorula paludigena]|uniref:Uncharacterized protein n=1 Tax=Rhodotorula paludigena TaxID=86838 RepID=A0AAV5GJT1_9BASI|nr:hypothetical protein Rhopal_001899-T1 [Rhodotorula paludigena]
MSSTRQIPCLVWKEHKRVCGPAANPFLWPLLTQQEAEDAVANKDFRVRDPDAPDFPSLSENLQDLGMSASIVDDVIRQLATPAPLPLPSTDALKQILIGAVRYFEMQRLDEIQVATRQHVSTPMHLVTVADHNVFGYPLEITPLHSIVRHGFLIRHAVLRAAERRMLVGDLSPSFILKSVDALNWYAQDMLGNVDVDEETADAVRTVLPQQLGQLRSAIQAIMRR